LIAYVETSAAAKLVFQEAESEALKRHLNKLVADGDGLYSSFLLETELRRAAVRTGAAQEKVTDVIDRFNLIELDPTIFREAGLMSGRNLRSLDALHLVAAIRIRADTFITYDERQANASREIGLRTVAPA